MTVHAEKSHLIPFHSHFVKLCGIYGSTHGASIIPFARVRLQRHVVDGNAPAFKTVRSQINQDTSQQRWILTEPTGIPFIRDLITVNYCFNIPDIVVRRETRKVRGKH